PQHQRCEECHEGLKQQHCLGEHQDGGALRALELSGLGGVRFVGHRACPTPLRLSAPTRIRASATIVTEPVIKMPAAMSCTCSAVCTALSIASGILLAICTRSSPKTRVATAPRS